MTRQAIQLGLLPRLQITQTPAEGHDQIYLPAVNWPLMVVTLGLSIGFGSSSIVCRHARELELAATGRKRDHRRVRGGGWRISIRQCGEDRPRRDRVVEIGRQFTI
jgi:hypothetical protein